MEKIIEKHPLPPFLPANAKLLVLGSFPPQQKRWSIDFFYPNMQNDMWRIIGLHFFQNKDYFVDIPNKKFKKEAIIDFLTHQGIALYDTATAIHRLQNNASDKYLEIISPTNICDLLQQLPLCRAIATTGQKATDILCDQFRLTEQPTIGNHIYSTIGQERLMQFYRMPSSSRAYPLSLEKKAAIYGKMFNDIFK